MTSFCIPFFQELEREFQLLKVTDKNAIQHSLEMISFLEKKLKKVNLWVKKYTFDSDKEEIHFFKELKPSLVSKIYFYKCVFDLESSLPKSKKRKRKQYLKELDKISNLSKSDRDIYTYHRSRATYNDDSFFIRKTYKDIIINDPVLVNFDSKMSTSHDHFIAKIIASDMLTNYIELKIEEIDKGVNSIINTNPVSYTWSGSKIDLVELIYALKYSGLINNGDVEVKELASHIGKLFNIELEDTIYRTFQDLKSRKTVKTKFINTLAENLNRKLEEDDL